MSSKPPSEADIVFNRASVALAQTQRLIQSWLPPQTAEEAAASSKAEEDRKRENEALFKPTSEVLGVGAVAADDALDSVARRRKTAFTLDGKLAEQLLGKKAVKGHRATTRAPIVRPGELGTVVTKTLSRQDSEDEEEESRASMLTSKRGKKRKQGPAIARTEPLGESAAGVQVETSTADDSLPDAEAHVEENATKDKASPEEEDIRPAKKRGGTYLDQLLAEKAKKKSKKQKEGQP